MNELDLANSSQPTNVVVLLPSSESEPHSSALVVNDVAPIGEEHGADEECEQGRCLPVIFLDREFHVVLDDAMRALASDPTVFAKGDQLVRVMVDGDVPRLVSLGSAQVRELLSLRARWMKDEAVHPPAGVASALARRGAWKYVRELRAMTTFPVLSASGDLRTEEGYDEATRTFYVSGSDVSVSDRPTREDAERACGQLLDLVSDFPFAGDAHKSAWLAALLTPLARYMHDGNAPLVVIEANMPGSGKTMLAQTIATIVTGSAVSVMACEKGEPNRKEILSKLRASPSIALIDNVVGRFGGPNMATLITSRSFEDRAMGHLKTLSAPNDTTWLMTGNRITLAPDMARRCLHVRLQSTADKPHLRRDFHYPDLLQHAREHRQELLSAALTVLKAYAVARLPEVTMEAWGSFEPWSRVVRGALVWCGLPDPASTRQELEDEAEESSTEHARWVHGWRELQEATNRCDGLTVREALTLLDGAPSAAPVLHEMIEALPRRGGHPDALVISRRLREAKDRNFDGSILRSLGSPKEALRWTVVAVP